MSPVAVALSSYDGSVIHYYAFACRSPRLSVRSFVRPSVRSSGLILFPRYLMNTLNKFDETDIEYSLALTDDLIRLRRSKVKLTAAVEVAKTSTLTLRRRSLSVSLCVLFCCDRGRRLLVRQQWWTWHYSVCDSTATDDVQGRGGVWFHDVDRKWNVTATRR